MLNCPKNKSTKYLNFTWHMPEKNNKMPKFYVILPEKIFSGFFFFWGGGAKCPSPTPMRGQLTCRMVTSPTGQQVDKPVGAVDLYSSLCAVAPPVESRCNLINSNLCANFWGLGVNQKRKDQRLVVTLFDVSSHHKSPNMVRNHVHDE